MLKLAVVFIFLLIIQLSTTEEQLPTGFTKTGKPCMEVLTWGNGTGNSTEENKVVNDFVARQKNLKTNQTTQSQLYDCYLDVDTEEYELVSFKRTVSEFFKYTEVISFRVWNTSLEPTQCETFTYTMKCEEKRNGLNYCVASKNCEGNLSFELLISLCPFVTSFFIVCLLCWAVALVAQKDPFRNISREITLTNISHI